jgi:hypothetical protein
MTRKYIEIGQTEDGVTLAVLLAAVCTNERTEVEVLDLAFVTRVIVSHSIVFTSDDGHTS